MSNEHQIVMKVPEEIIKAQVQAAVVASLTSNGSALIAEVIRAAMSEKVNSYGNSPTRWDQMVSSLITEVARESMKTWIESHRAEIGKRMTEALERNKKQRINAIADQMISAVSQNMSINVSIESKERY